MRTALHDSAFEAFRHREFAIAESQDDHVPGLRHIIEESGPWTHTRPRFVLNLSDKAVPDWIMEQLETPASYLCRHSESLLFAQNSTLDSDGSWGCETMQFRLPFIDSYLSDFFQAHFPGPKPAFSVRDGLRYLSVNALTLSDIAIVEEPIFLATPLEPDNWGRWIATVVPKAMLFREYGAGRQFFCRLHHGWQRAVLNGLGIPDERLLEHRPGLTYLCADLATIRYSATSMVNSALTRELYLGIAREMGAELKPGGSRLFVSRRTGSKKRPRYRVLGNEDALISALEARGFEIFEPELHSFGDQVRKFAAADIVVCLGGAGLYNVVFCQPGTRVVTIESSNIFIRPHSRLIASMGFDYGVVFGREDPDDPAPSHKRWTLDIAKAVARIDEFCQG